jgi:hypothetical protein
MKKILSSLIILLLAGSFSNLTASENPSWAIRYKIIIDFGTDMNDPLFSDYSLMEYIKERMHQRLPDYYYTGGEDANVIISIGLLTNSSENINYKFISALNMLITSYLHNPINKMVLLIEDREETAKEKIRDYIDRWILEYSAFIYKSYPR